MYQPSPSAGLGGRTDVASGNFNDCGGVDGDTQSGMAPDAFVHNASGCGSAMRVQHRPVSQFNSGPQSPIQPQRLAAPEIDAFQTARCNPPPRPPSVAGDDFGLFIALAWAIPAGATIWGIFFWLVA